MYGSRGKKGREDFEHLLLCPRLNIQNYKAFKITQYIQNYYLFKIFPPPSPSPTLLAPFSNQQPYQTKTPSTANIRALLLRACCGMFPATRSRSRICASTTRGWTLKMGGAVKCAVSSCSKV